MSTHRRLFGSIPSTHLSSNPPKITLKNFSFCPSDHIGKGFSASVYKGINEQSSTFLLTQSNQWLSRRSTWRASRTMPVARCLTLRSRPWRQFSILMCCVATMSFARVRIATSLLSTVIKGIFFRCWRKNAKWQRRKWFRLWGILWLGLWPLDKTSTCTETWNWQISSWMMEWPRLLILALLKNRCSSISIQFTLWEGALQCR